MAVVYVKELWDGRTGSDGIERKRQYTRRFEVKTDNPQDDATVAGGREAREMGLPGNGDKHPIDADALMIRITPDQSSEDPTLWYVTCNYDTNLPKAQARETQQFNPDTGTSQEGPQPNKSQRPDNPLDRLPQWKVSYESNMEIAKFNSAGELIQDCANMPYETPPEIEKYYPVITITKNYKIVKFDWLDQFVGAVHGRGPASKPVKKWFGREYRTCRMVGISYEGAYENGVSFWPVTFTIKVRPQTWDLFLLEAGFYEKYEAGAIWKRRECRNFLKTGEATKPMPLDGKRLGSPAPVNGVIDLANVTITGKEGRGQQLAPADPDDPTSAPSLVYSRWAVLPEKNFFALGI